MRALLKKFRWLPLALVVSCAGVQRDCASCNASNYGADWIVVKRSLSTGDVITCYQLRNTAVTNEGQSDGVFWEMPGGLVHLTNSDRIQVVAGDYPGAAKALGVDLSRCPGGAYLPEE